MKDVLIEHFKENVVDSSSPEISLKDLVVSVDAIIDSAESNSDDDCIKKSPDKLLLKACNSVFSDVDLGKSSVNCHHHHRMT